MEKHLSDIEKIRKRPGMYVGGIDDYGVLMYALEIFSNAIDAVYRSEKPKVSILSVSPYIEIRDNGPGFPISAEKYFESHDTIKTKNPRYFLEKFHTTPTADNHAPHFHSGRMYGGGLAVVNALSDLFKIETWRKGTLWTCEYSRGQVVRPFEKIDEGDGKGTTIIFRPDPDIFNDYTDIHAAFRERVIETSYLIPRIEYEFLNETYYSENGLFDLLDSALPSFKFDKEIEGFRVLGF